MNWHLAQINMCLRVFQIPRCYISLQTYNRLLKTSLTMSKCRRILIVFGMEVKLENQINVKPFERQSDPDFTRQELVARGIHYSWGAILSTDRSQTELIAYIVELSLQVTFEFIQYVILVTRLTYYVLKEGKNKLLLYKTNLLQYKNNKKKMMVINYGKGIGVLVMSQFYNQN